MSLLEFLHNKIANIPQLSSELKEGGLRIQPNHQGFPITIEEDDNQWTVCFGESGYHEHFFDEGDVKRCVAWACSEKVRLRTIWRGNVASKTMLESLENEEWVVVGTTGLLFFPFWRPIREEITLGSNVDTIEI